MSYVFQFFCGPQVAQQGNAAVKKAGAMARSKATMAAKATTFVGSPIFVIVRRREATPL